MKVWTWGRKVEWAGPAASGPFCKVYLYAYPLCCFSPLPHYLPPFNVPLLLLIGLVVPPSVSRQADIECSDLLQNASWLIKEATVP